MPVIDLLLLLMVLIWGANFAVVKGAFADIAPAAFNGLRLVLASSLFGIAILWGRHLGAGADVTDATVRPRRFSTAVRRVLRPSVVDRRDWVRFAALGAIGHFVYQMCFIGGLQRTSAANSALILACSPVFVSFLSAAAGHERIGRLQWAGIGLTVLGMYFVAGRNFTASLASASGDLLTLAAALCWAIYTVGARPMLERHSPLLVTAYTLIAGGAVYVVVHAGVIAATDWSRVPVRTWLALVGSALLAINVAYLIWYIAVQRIGNARTAVWSNVTPLVAMSAGVLVLGEHVDTWKLVGAAAILGGVAMTRLAHPPANAVESAPPEE